MGHLSGRHPQGWFYWPSGGRGGRERSFSLTPLRVTVFRLSEGERARPGPTVQVATLGHWTLAVPVQEAGSSSSSAGLAPAKPGGGTGEAPPKEGVPEERGCREQRPRPQGPAKCRRRRECRAPGGGAQPGPGRRRGARCASRVHARALSPVARASVKGPVPGTPPARSRRLYPLDV